MSFAPVVVFAYNRPEHLRRTLDALAANRGAAETPVIVFSDAAKNSQAEQRVHEVRQLLAGYSGFSEFRVILRPFNFGLARSVIEGVTEILNEFGRVIVLEDDLETSPFFLEFMNDALCKYSEVPQVGSVHGYLYPASEPFSQNFFLRGADCWGWGTWQRAWNDFDPDGRRLFNKLISSGRRQEFDFFNSFPFTEMLEDQFHGLNHSWAIRWQASMFLQNRLVLYPRESLVRNIGLDSSGQHCEVTDKYNVRLAEKKVDVIDIPLVETPGARLKIAQFYQTFERSWKAKLPFRLRQNLRALKRHLRF